MEGPPDLASPSGGSAVKAPDAPVRREMFMAVWVTGTLSTEAHNNDVGDAGYTLQATKIEPYL